MSNMQGSKNCLKTQILNEEDRAISVWCYAHNCNLASSNSMKKCQVMKNSFCTGEDIVKTVRWSPKRNARLNQIKLEVQTEDDEIKAGNIKTFARTRWTVNWASLKSIVV